MMVLSVGRFLSVSLITCLWFCRLVRSSEPRLNGNLTYHGCNVDYVRQYCSTFKLNGPPVPAGDLWGPECEFLRRRLQCAIYLLNCPYVGQTLQLYDIPCQTSCIAAHNVCLNRLGILPQSQSSQASTNNGQGWSTGSQHKTGRTTMQWRHFPMRDCRLLPTGVCDEWGDYMISTHYLNATQIKASVRTNEGCVPDKRNCDRMFPPKTIRKDEFMERNFTDILMMEFTQTMWLLTRSSFHPFFRMSIRSVYRSSVHIDQQTMFMHPWPLPCPCPNKLLVGGRYIMLTHSIWPRGALNISTETVFLRKNKRNKRKIKCWLKKVHCSKRSRRKSRKKKNRRNSRNLRRNPRSTRRFIMP